MTKYKCIKCGTMQTRNSHPSAGKCSDNEAHEWVEEDGLRKKYKCIKCGIVIDTNSHPRLGKCVKGGGHQWKC